jgi:hypothetical protein
MSQQDVHNVQQAARASLFTRYRAQKNIVKPALAGQVIANFYRCRGCSAWWIATDLDAPESNLAFELVEPHGERYLWQDYAGWRLDAEDGRCKSCDQENDAPDCTLRFDEKGYVVWPRLRLLKENGRGEGERAAGEHNPFAEYVSQSKNIGENMFVIAAWEARREMNAPGYAADINDMREQMEEMRLAFKDVVYSYAPLLPPGWRVTGDFDKWLKGQACAGFLHGEIQPDASLMIGGCSTSVADLEMKLDALFRFVCQTAC